MDPNTPFLPPGWPPKDPKRPVPPKESHKLDKTRVTLILTPANGVAERMVKQEASASPPGPSSRLFPSLTSDNYIKSSSTSIKSSPCSSVHSHIGCSKQEADDEGLFVDQESASRPRDQMVKASGGVINLESEEYDSGAGEFSWPMTSDPAKNVVDETQELLGEFKPKARGHIKIRKEIIARRRQDNVRASKHSVGNTGGIKKKRSSRAFKSAARPALNSGVKGIKDNFAILGYDPIAAHHAEAQVNEASSIEASTKTKQLADMLAGCPPGSDQRRNKADVNAIEKASRVFGHHKVKAKDGFWLPEGMKTGMLCLTDFSQGC